MPYCQYCGHNNADNAVSCSACKRPMNRTCHNCQNEISVAAKYCPQCGALQQTESSPKSQTGKVDNRLESMMPTSLAVKMNQAVANLTGERREATVLCWIIDIPLKESSRLDAETRYLLNDKIMRHLADIVYEYEGTIDRYSGDYLTAFFGIPLAHENDAERAVRSALDIKKRLNPLINKINAEYHTHITTRTGIHTGKVIVSKNSEVPQTNYTIVGNIIDHAEILRDSADSGTILASFDTYQRTKPLIQYERIPLLTTRGASDLVWAFRPLRIKANPGRVRGLPGDPSPMIGRDDALRWLQTVWYEMVHTKQSRVVMVTGEAGVGKTRLVTEFYHDIEETDAQIYLGSCMTYARATPLHLIKSILRDMLFIDKNESLTTQYQQLTDTLTRIGVDQQDILPYLALALDLEHSDSGLYARIDNLDDEALQKLTHAAIRQIIEIIAQIQPMALIFEDLHWVDSASRSVIDYLLQTLDHAPVLLILISRSSERGTVIKPLIETASRLRQPMLDLRLNPLSPDDISKLISHLMHKTSQAANSLVNQIVTRADGNPMYAEEIVRMLVDHGGIHQIRDTWYITNKAEELIQKTPGTLGDLILARFDRLEENSRDVLYKASVCGLSFPTALLKQITSLTDSQIYTKLDALIQKQFIISEAGMDRERYTFRHALIHEVIYGTILRKDRQQLHSKIATVLEENADLIGEQERIELLAHHHAASTNPDKAVPYLLKAADNAARRCDYETTILHYRNALKNISPTSPTHSDNILQAKIGLGRALKFIGENTEASSVLREALQAALYSSIKVDLLDRIVDGLRELAEIRHIEGASEEAVEFLEAGIAAIEKKGKQQYITLWRSLIDRMAWICFRQGELESAFELAGSATLGLNPEREEDPMTLASLYNTLGGILWEQGNLTEAVSYVQLSSRLYTEQRYIWGMANADVNLGVLYFAQGDWKLAAQHFAQADKYWLQMGDLQHRAVTLNNLGILRQGMGQYDIAERHFNDSLELFQRLGDIWNSARVHISLARFHLEQSERKLALEHVTQASELLKVVGAEDVELTWIKALTLAGKDLKTALITAEKALELARETHLLDQEAECLLALGKLRIMAGDYQQAESLFRESVDLNLQAHAPYGLGLALLELGKLYQLLAKGHTEGIDEWHNRAEDVLKQAVQQFSKLGAARDLSRAQKVLLELGSLPSPHSAAGESITKTHIDKVNVLPEGEQRQATIIYLPMSTPVDVDEEDIFEATSNVVQIVAATAEQFQGQVVRQHDGIMLVFGAPKTYEDDPERAVRAAWEILEQLNSEAGITNLVLKHGIASAQGLVIAGNVGPLYHTAFMVEGNPVTTAKNIVTHIPPGELWVSEAVKKTTERIAIYQPATGQENFWTLTKFHEQPRQMRGIPGLRSRLIGRDSNLSEMVDLTRYLSQRVGGLVWIEGEPGIGKSRLMNEFATVMSAQGIDVWQGGCSPQTSEQAFSMFTDLLTERFDLHPRDPTSVIQEKVTALFSSWPRSLQITQPYLEVLLGAWPAGLPGERLAKLEPEQLRQQIFVSLRRFFKVLSQQNPLVIILDDLHWVDTISAELLHFMLTLIASSPIIFVCAQRRQGADEPNDRLVRLRSLIPSQTRYLQLQRLTQEEREALLDELLPRNQIPVNLRTSILNQSDGNPYFIEEFIRMLVEQGYLAQQEDQWVVNQTMNTDEMPLPPSLDLLIRARIDALPSELKQVVQVAAVLGAPFDMEILQAVCDIPEIDGMLNRLASRLLIRQIQDNSHWTFHHPLIEGVAYKSIMNVRRQAYHRTTAEILEKRWAGVESEHAEVLSYHLTRANESIRALNYLIIAGEKAAARFANEQAVSYFEQAAQVLSTLPGTSDTLRWRLAAGLGDVYRATGQLDDSMAALRAGMALMETGRVDPLLRAGLYRRMGDTMRKQGDYQTASSYFKAATLILEEPQTEEFEIELARTFIGSAWVQFHQGLFEKAREAAESALAYAEDAGSIVDLAAVENLLGGLYYSQSEWALASQHTRRAMVLREQMGYSWGVASTLGNLGVLAVLEGDWHKARSFFERSLDLRKEMDDVEGLALVHNNLGMLLRDQGNLDKAESHFRDSLEASKPFAHSYHTANATLGLAYVLFLKNEQSTARQMLTQAIQLAEEIGASDVLMEAGRIQVEMYIAGENLESALESARNTLEQAQESGNREHQPSLWRLISIVELSMGNAESAQQALNHAQELLDSVTNMLEFGRTHAQAACIALAMDDSEKADSYMKTAQSIFMRLGAGLDLERIHQLAVYRNPA